jgi:signal transduction histidine kinase
LRIESKKWQYRKLVLLMTLVLPGIAAVLASYFIRGRTLAQMHRMLHSHVNSVTALVKKSVSQGAWSTATIYTLYEEQLLTTAHLISHLDDVETQDPERMDGALGDVGETAGNSRSRAQDSDLLDAEQITVFLSGLESPSVLDRWGEVPLKMREPLRRSLLDAPVFELLETSLLRRLGLICMVFETGTLQPHRGALCHDDGELTELKHASGIGPLLDELVNANLTWVVLQDADGVLAAAPSDVTVSRWRDDQALRGVLQRTRPVIRHVLIDGTPHMEGMAPFEMVDGSRVVLRVAVNTAVSERIREAADRRHYTVIVLVVIIELLLLGLGLAYQRWRRRQSYIEQAMAEQEEERKHWELIGGLSATVAHEVRNPLNTISMTSERLRYEFTVPEDEKQDYERFLLILKREATQLNRIVTDFLELGKPNRLQPEITDVGEFTRESASHFIVRSEMENKPIELDVSTDVFAAIDRRRFHQVITNLINNAMEASESGTRIGVRVRGEGDNVLVEIADEGCGMTDEQLAEALTPFVSFKANGTGLGLALVDRLVRLHRGTVTLRRNSPRGIVVEIQLPASAPPPTATGNESRDIA